MMVEGLAASIFITGEGKRTVFFIVVGGRGPGAKGAWAVRSLTGKRWPPIPIIENLSGVTERTRLEGVRALFSSIDTHSHSNKTNNRKTLQPKRRLISLCGDVRRSVSDCLLQ